MKVWIIDNRSDRGSLKASMTERLVAVLGEWFSTTHVVRTAAEAARIDGGIVVLSGSSLSITAVVPQPAAVAVTVAQQKRLPVLGICFGFQMLAWLHGLPVRKLSQTVRAWRTVEAVGEVYFHHGDGVFPTEEEGPATQIQFSPRVLGVQFHPEATDDGRAWLARWVGRWQS